MTQTANNAEGGTNGTTVSVANSGGASGNAWDDVIFGGGALVYSSTQKMHGLLSYFFTMAASGTQLVKRYLASSTANYASRFYVYIPTGTHPGTIYLWAPFTTTTGTTENGIVAYNTGLSKFQVYDAGAAFKASTANTYATNTWWRVEITVTGATGTTSGQLVLKIYAGDSATATETLTVSAGNFGSSNTAAIGYGYPLFGSTDSVGIYLDDIAENDTGTAIGVPTTNISLSRIFKWNVRAAVTPFTRTFKWNVRATLSLSRIFKWNVRSALSTTRIFKWNVRTAVTPFTRTFKWNVIAGVLISRTFKWNTIQTIIPTRIFRWNVRTSVTPFSRVLLWNTRSQTSLSRTFIWLTYQQITTSRVFKWNTRTALSIARTVKWNVIGGVLITRTFLWETFVLWTKSMDCTPEVWTLINQTNATWTTETVNSTTWR